MRSLLLALLLFASCGETFVPPEVPSLVQISWVQDPV